MIPHLNDSSLDKREVHYHHDYDGKTVHETAYKIFFDPLSPFIFNFFQSFDMLYLLILFPLLFFLAAYPLKNWLEIRSVKKLDAQWTTRIKSLPSKDRYCSEHQRDEVIFCEYCDFDRQRPYEVATVPKVPQWGFIANKLTGESDYRIDACARCGTKLYGQKISKSPNFKKQGSLD